MTIASQVHPKVQVAETAPAEAVQPFVEPLPRQAPALIVTEAAEMLMEADFATKKAVIDNLKPSEQEMKIRKEARKAAREKDDAEKMREQEALEARYEADDLERQRSVMV